MRADVLLSGGATRLEGPLLFLKRQASAGLFEAVEVMGADRAPRIGRVAALDADSMVVEILEETQRLSLSETVVRLTGEPVTFPVGPGLLGRTFNGVGAPADGGPPVAAREFRPVDAPPMNPAGRAVPSEYIETGITAID
ncbi:MAG: V-type ATP synthase subunit B, partial [Alphaproteobacteria bacterium]